jgi:hypothetical protein
MIASVRNLGDRLLARLVPALDASACTAPERECYCDGDNTGPSYCCEVCRYCPGTGYTCASLGCRQGCP